MQINRVKEALRAGKCQFGAGWSQFRSQDVARILQTAGFDWAFIDAEHGGFGIETVRDICLAAAQAGITPVVRVADLQYSLMARALDCSSQGIILPRVESADLLKRAVAWTKFPPEGTRGYGLGGPQLGYQTHPFADVIRHMNANTLVVLQIETVRAFEVREELLAVPGIDAVLIGPADLSVSLGIPGEFQHPRMVETIEGIRDACVRRGVAPGIHMRSPALAKFWVERGMRFVSCGNEVSFLHERASDVASQLQNSASLVSPALKNAN
ncbi:MAG: HpcH/HpaI aldolase family protein [Terriglobia bacterium]